MKRLVAAVAALVSLALSGCYISETPLIGPDDAVFPYQTIAYREGKDAQGTIIRREGDSYVARSTDGKDRLDMRFKDLGDGLYLAQMIGENDGKTSILYAVLKVDWATRKVESYRAVGGSGDDRPGLRKCNEGMVCIDDLDAYVALARETIASGKPDVTYEILVTE